MDETPDKPSGTEQHPQGRNPSRQGPPTRRLDDEGSQGPVPESGEPGPEASPGEPGVTSPKQGKV